MIIQKENIVIEIIDVKASNVGSYASEYPKDLGIKSQFQASNRHGIRIMENGKEKCSVIILESGGSTGVSENSVILKKDLLLICCSDYIYSLNLDDLSLNWRKQFDLVTCFGIYDFQSDFIIHGEISISRITLTGELEWYFSGKDIFVNPNGKQEITFNGDLIKLIDFADNEYILNFNGELI